MARGLQGERTSPSALRHVRSRADCRRAVGLRGRIRRRTCGGAAGAPVACDRHDAVHGAGPGANGPSRDESLCRSRHVGGAVSGTGLRCDGHRRGGRRLRRRWPARCVHRQQDRPEPAVSQSRPVEVRGRHRTRGARRIDPERDRRRDPRAVRKRGGGGHRAVALDAGCGVRGREQRWPARSLRLPLRRPEPALREPGRWHVQGGGRSARSGAHRRERDGGVLRLRSRRLARRLCANEPVRPGEESGRPARPAVSKSWRRHILRSHRRGRHRRRVDGPFGDVVGLRPRRLARPVCRQRLRGARPALSQQPGRHVHRRRRRGRATHGVLFDGRRFGRREQRRADRPARRRHGGDLAHQGPARDGRVAGARAAGAGRDHGCAAAHAQRAVREHRRRPDAGGGESRRVSGDGLDVVGAVRGPRQRRPARPARDQRHEPRVSQRRSARPHHGVGKSRRLAPADEGIAAIRGTESGVSKSWRPELRGSWPRLGARSRRREFRGGVRRFRWRWRPRPGVRQLRGGAHRAAQRQREGPSRDPCVARLGLEPLRRGRDRAAGNRRRRAGAAARARARLPVEQRAAAAFRARRRKRDPAADDRVAQRPHADVPGPRGGPALYDHGAGGFGGAGGGGEDGGGRVPAVRRRERSAGPFAALGGEFSRGRATVVAGPFRSARAGAGVSGFRRGRRGRCRDRRNEPATGANPPERRGTFRAVDHAARRGGGRRTVAGVRRERRRPDRSAANPRWRQPSGEFAGLPAGAAFESRRGRLCRRRGRVAGLAGSRRRCGGGRLRPRRPARRISRRAKRARPVSECAAQRAAAQCGRTVRGRDGGFGAGVARCGHGDVGDLDRRGSRRLA